MSFDFLCLLFWLLWKAFWPVEIRSQSAVDQVAAVVQSVEWDIAEPIGIFLGGICLAIVLRRLILGKNLYRQTFGPYRRGWECACSDVYRESGDPCWKCGNPRTPVVVRDIYIQDFWDLRLVGFDKEMDWKRKAERAAKACEKAKEK